MQRSARLQIMVTMGSTRSLAATSAGWFREVDKAAVTRRNKKLRERGNNVGSSAGLTIAATTIYGALKMGGRDGRPSPPADWTIRCLRSLGNCMTKFSSQDI